MMPIRASFSGLVALLFVSFMAFPSLSQPVPCGVPDGLDGGPCCAPTDVNLPQLPSITQESKFVCWRDCSPGLSGPVIATIRPSEVLCGYYLTRFQFTNQGGNLTAWSGRLIMVYSRTWAEDTPSEPGSPVVQVFRFLVNGDMRPSADLVERFGLNACVVPPCFFEFDAFHVSGYIDFAFDCANQRWSIAYALNHECDAFEHTTPLSLRTGNFHPERSYTWVGPGSTFACDPDVLSFPQSARNVGESARHYDLTQVPQGPICEYEQPSNGVGRLFLQEEGFCPCETAGTPQYEVRFHREQSCLVFAESDLDTPPWRGLVQKKIGRWFDPNVYPGAETLLLAQGLYDYQDLCEQETTLELFRGVHTLNGPATFEVSAALTFPPIPNRLLDLGNAISFPAGTLAIGVPAVTDKLLFGAWEF